MTGVGVCEDTIGYAYMNERLTVPVESCLLVIINIQKDNPYGMILSSYTVFITYER